MPRFNVLADSTHCVGGNYVRAAQILQGIDIGLIRDLVRGKMLVGAVAGQEYYLLPAPAAPLDRDLAEASTYYFPFQLNSRQFAKASATNKTNRHSSNAPQIHHRHQFATRQEIALLMGGLNTLYFSQIVSSLLLRQLFKKVFQNN